MENGERCEHLCWKGMFIDAPRDPDIPTDDGLVWCHLTQTCLGPDGQIADILDCNPSRPCYKPL
jgi:hypothetical protein